MKIINKFFNKHFLIFILIGFFNTFSSMFFAVFINKTIYIKFVKGNISFILGYVVSLCIAYILNSYINYKTPFNIIKLLKFSLAYIPSFIIQNAIIFIFYEILEFKYEMVCLASVIINIPINFLLIHTKVFNK